MKHAVAPVGDLAKGGANGDGRNMGTSVGEAMAAQATAQKVHIWALKVDGETIGEWVNEAVTPGSNFSWAPAPAPLIVYAKRDGGPLSLLDDRGRKTDAHRREKRVVSGLVGRRRADRVAGEDGTGGNMI